MLVDAVVKLELEVVGGSDGIRLGLELCDAEIINLVVVSLKDVDGVEVSKLTDMEGSDPSVEAVLSIIVDVINWKIFWSQ